MFPQYAVQIEAQLLRSQVIVQVIEQHPHHHHVWRWPLTWPLWEQLGPTVGHYVVSRYAAARPCTRHQLPAHSLAAAVQLALSQVEAAFRLPGLN